MLPWVNGWFWLTTPAGDDGLAHGGGVGRGGAPALELITAVPLARHRALAAEKFSLVFRGGPEVNLVQGIHRLTHPRLGTLDLFLTPIVSRQGRGQQYEAVINREPAPRPRMAVSPILPHPPNSGPLSLHS
jgi:hypothetical protein